MGDHFPGGDRPLLAEESSSAAENSVHSQQIRAARLLPEQLFWKLCNYGSNVRFLFCARDCHTRSHTPLSNSCTASVFISVALDNLQYVPWACECIFAFYITLSNSMQHLSILMLAYLRHLWQAMGTCSSSRIFLDHSDRHQPCE